MTYNKPSNMSYTEIAKWVDDNAYLPDVNEMQLYKYLYLLSDMLAKRYGYFTNAELYDLFALFSASRLTMRLRGNVQQIIPNSDGSIKSTEKVKSILNYIKKVIYPYKVDFENEYVMKPVEGVEIISLGRIDIGESLSERNDVFDMFELHDTLQNSATLIQSFLGRIPRSRNSAEWHNIYISCMLTLIDQMTLTPSQIASIRRLPENRYLAIEELLKENLNRSPVLYHLDESMNNYIKVLVREIRHLLAAEMHWKSGQHYTAESAVKAVIIESMLEENEDGH